jgi:hypothetical protein
MPPAIKRGIEKQKPFKFADFPLTPPLRHLIPKEY